MRHLELAEARALLLSRADLARRGIGDREVARRVEFGTLRKVRRGWWVDRAVWDDLWPESQHRVHLAAVMRDSRSSEVVAGYQSAAAGWGLPLYRSTPARVHLVTPTADRISSGSDVFRHAHELPLDDIVLRSGIPCTSLERTTFDLARVLAPEAALAIADAALRQVAWRRDEYDEAAAESWRAALKQRADSAPGARGIRQARWIIGLMDGRAQLPGESVSRLHLVRLGFTALRLQVPVPSPGGGRYFVDLGLDDVQMWGEFDGESKYLDEAMRSGRTLEEVLLAEKRREDWIRGVTGRRVLRWSHRDIDTPETLGRRLAAFGVRTPC